MTGLSPTANADPTPSGCPFTDAHGVTHSNPIICGNPVSNTLCWFDSKLQNPNLGPCDLIDAAHRLGVQPVDVCTVPHPSQQLPADAKAWCFNGHWPDQPGPS